jgi:hypothetical protein
MPDDTATETTGDGVDEAVDLHRSGALEQLRLVKGALVWTNQMDVNTKRWMRDQLDYEIREGIGA